MNKEFHVGKEYKVFYYHGLNRVEFEHTAKCLEINHDIVTFHVGQKIMDYTISYDIFYACDAAVHIAAKRSPQIVERMPAGVIYACNEIE